MGFVHHVTRGGQTWAHQMRMLKQVTRMMLFFSIAFGLLFFAFRMWQEPKEDLQATYYHSKASALIIRDKIDVDAKFWCKVSRRCYQAKKVSVDRGTVKKECQPRRNMIFDRGIEVGKEAGSVVIMAFGACLIFYAFRGRFTKGKHHIQGVRLEKPWKVRLKMRFLRKSSGIKLGQALLLKGSETKHILICGTTGSGKTNALRQLLHQIRLRGDRALIVDTTGDFVAKFYQEKKDLLLNPYDMRSETWHPWCECKKKYDYEHLVNSLIPKGSQKHDNFFPEAARAVILASLLHYRKQGKSNMEMFVQGLLRKDVKELFDELEDTDARMYVDPKGERTTASIRSTIANYIRHFDMLPNTTSPFSIRNWILSEKANNEWMFLTCQTEQRDALQSLISVWFSIALHAMQQRPLDQGNKKKIWLVIDELHSLQKLEYLASSLAEMRKYGGAIVLATQNVAQLEEIYGYNGTRIILDQCSTKVSFRQTDPEIAKKMSSFFGQYEFKEAQEGLSYGSHEMRDGVNLSMVERSKATIPATQILSLPDLQAFIKLPGNWPALKSKFRYFKQKNIAASYQEDPQIDFTPNTSKKKEAPEYRKQEQSLPKVIAFEETNPANK